MKFHNISKAVIAVLFVCGVSMYSHAQAGSAEVAVGGGWASYRAQGQSTNKGKFDASVSANVFKTLAVGFEYGYTPISSQTFSVNGQAATASANLQTYGGVLRAGLTHEQKFQPYVLFAGGGSRISASASSGGQTASASQSGGYFGFGGGLNARIIGGFGVRPEVRYQRVSISGSSVNELDVTGTLFYTFGGRHKK